MVQVIKKDGTLEDFSFDKIKNAVNKSSERVMKTLSKEDFDKLYGYISERVLNSNDNVHVSDMHYYVEQALSQVDEQVAKSYRDYRNYKTSFVEMQDKVFKESQTIRYIGDKENSNSDSSLVATKRSLIYGVLNKELYKKFFLNKQEIQAIKEGYLYIHDMNARLDSLNCCLLDVGNILKGGFEMGNIWYNEPKSLDTAFDVIGDIIFSASAQQYGGLTVPEIDSILEPYAKKSLDRYVDEYYEIATNYTDESSEYELLNSARDYSFKKVKRDLEQGLQGLEYKLNTVGSSRGDYPFISISFGTNSSEIGSLINKTILNVRRKGQGKEGFKKPVLFPKLIFLFDKEIHGEGAICEDVFNCAIECSSVSMYPDWLSLSGEGYVPEMYRKYKRVVSPMGCRAFLSPWYEKGGMKPLDEFDKPVFVGRSNLGVISLHLPMILAKSRREDRNFYEVLDEYLEIARKLHIRTYEYLGEMRASTNPLGFCEGGFYNGNLKYGDKIKDVIKAFTLSFGITALNELQQLYNKKSLVEDGQFAIDVLTYINERVEAFKEEDGLLYAIYGSPAENLCGVQVRQFRKEFGVIENVSDREYVSNSFHCHVSEDITPIQKQDLEKRFWDLSNGGKIQYCKYPISYNKKAIKDLVRRAMDMGFYEGINLSLSYCNNCGYEELSMETCPKCGSNDLTKIERMNGYLSYSRVKGDSRLADHKMEEIKDRKSM